MRSRWVGVAWALGWPARTVLIGAIRAYRLTLAHVLGGQCRFYPSCSVYAEQSIRNVGAVRGSALAVWRILRCNPFSAGGVEPPPMPRGTKYEDVIRGDDGVVRGSREREVSAS